MNAPLSRRSSLKGRLLAAPLAPCTSISEGLHRDYLCIFPSKENVENSLIFFLTSLFLTKYSGLSQTASGDIAWDDKTF